MSNKVNLRDASKTNWASEANNVGYPGDENIKLGCLMRIADATELMAKNFLRMQSDLDYLSKRTREQNATIERLNRVNASLRGHLTRAKKLKNPTS